MHPYYTATIRERRQIEGLVWLSLAALELARTAQPGQYALARPSRSLDPLLWPVIFLAGADPTKGLVELLIDPRQPATAWLVDLPVGITLDLCAPLGTPFVPAPATQTLLLAGAGAALPALLFAARRHARRLSIALLLAGNERYLPPPFFLPETVEVQTSSAGDTALFDLLAAHTPSSPIRWADQILFALPPDLLSQASAAMRMARLRWERGLAQVVVAGPMPCGLGVCRACQIETRNGWQRRCVEGPVLDLRDIRLR